MKRKESEGSSSLDALLKLLPALAMSYPAITSLINQFTGQPQDNRASLQETVPKLRKP